MRSMVVAVGASGVLVLAGCGSVVEGTATPATDDADTSSSSSTTTSSSQQGDDEGGDVGFDAETGDCVALGGTIADATIDSATCGAGDSNYKVIAKAPTSSRCISDSDNFYARTVNGVERGVLCLDVDWNIGSCMEMSGEDPENIECTEPAIEGVRVVSIEEDAAGVDVCPVGASGYVYDQRRFVVCVEEL